MNSFTPGTQVVLADGSRKPIEQVKIGDQVMATDPLSGRTTPREVAATIVGQGVKRLVEITIPGGAVTATDEHRFWSPHDRRWTYAKDLREGSMLQTSTGTWVHVSAVRTWTTSQPVHNLSVGGDVHTYYVQAGALAVLNHNCDPVENGKPSELATELMEADFQGVSPLMAGSDEFTKAMGGSGQFL